MNFQNKMRSPSASRRSLSRATSYYGGFADLTLGPILIQGQARGLEGDFNYRLAGYFVFDLDVLKIGVGGGMIETT